MRLRYVLVILFFSARYFVANAQLNQLPSTHNSELGLPLTQNYTPSEYGAFDQNWDVTQDSLGIMYFANGDGVLTYDGVNWELIELPNLSTVFSLFITETGRIYVGGIDELGYLESNDMGKLQYVSLIPKIKKHFSEMGIIWKICAVDDNVFFISEKYILTWDGVKFEGTDNMGGDRIFSVNNILFKREKGKGLMEYKMNRFELVSHGALFSDKRIYSILPYNEDFLLITKDKLFIFNRKTIVEFITNVPQFFRGNKIHCAVDLKNGTFALGSINKGILILNQQGEKQAILTKSGTLISNSIYNLFQDGAGLLWASTQSGISKIEYPSPFSFYQEYHNTPSLVFDIQRYQGTLFLGSSEGLFYLNKEGDYFESLVLNHKYVGDLIVVKDKLLVAEGSGVYEMQKNGKAIKILNLTNNNVWCQSVIDTNRVFIGRGVGIVSMYHKNSKWIVENMFRNLHHDVNKIVESSTGILWLGIDKNEVISVSLNIASDTQVIKDPIIRTFTPADGLPNRVIMPYKINNHVYFIAGSEVYKFDQKTEKFVEEKEIFVKLGLENKKVKINDVDDDGNIWLIEYEGEERIDQIVAFHKNNGVYDVKRLGQERIINLRRFGVYPEFEDSILWFKGKQGVVRHDLKQRTTQNAQNSKVMISGVFWNNDSLLFGGYGFSTVPEFLFKNNQLRFQFAAPSFYDESKNQFQYKLEGFDESWSSWTLETKKDYTNIPEGNYTFMVRAKNIFNEISEEDSYAFIILPPWYRTWWMYLIYAFGAIVLVLLISQWRSKELRRKNENLEEIVKERTVEIQHKNELLNHQTEKLVELDTAKTQLYTNITHEFRTPLTVILGVADVLKSNAEKGKLQKAEQSLEMIERNGKKLLRLVNEMLDMAKLESGNIKLNMVQTDVIPFVKYLSESFHSLAEDKGINLTVYSEIDKLEMDFDANKLTAIITNLISNAVKFTPKNGKIIVHLNKMVKNEGELLVIKVRDDGLGIAEGELAHVFNRFYQADTGTAQYGTGIGLAIVKELVELMKGTINVESALGKGSVFTIKIPITYKAIKKASAKISMDKPMEVVNSISEMEESIENTSSELPLVLIIEDNVDVAHYLKTCLQGKYKTIHAINGKVGIDMAYEKIPNIIITDVMMPEKDGYEVCEVLKSDERTDHIPIIILTAKVTDKDRLAGLLRGADAYLAKPFQKAELFTRLDQLILLRKKMIGKMERGDFTKLLEKKVDNPETKFIQKVVKIIHEELSNEDLGALHLARKLYLSESQIYRKLKAITGKSTAVFIRSVRLQKAKEFILATDKTISEIAYEVGFNDPSWFSRTFKEEFGIAPNAMRN